MTAKRKGEEQDDQFSHPKRIRLAEPEESDSDSDSDEDAYSFDVDTYYNTAPDDTTPQCVSDFMDVAFKKCLPRRTRRFLAEEYPRPGIAAAKVPTTDSVLVDFMASDFPKRQDEQLSKVQASVIAACSPVANLWSELEAQEMKGTKSELIPADVVMGCIHATLTLVGNASSYISTIRRENIIKALPKSRQNLGKILKQVSKQDTIGEGTHLFGDDAMDQVSKRITTLESFRKSAHNADPKKQAPRSRFLGKGPAAKYRGRLGQSSWHLYGRNQTGGKNFQRQGSGHKGPVGQRKYLNKPGSSSKH